MAASPVSRLFGCACALGAAAPGIWLALAWECGALGSNPLETLLHTTGRSALALLVATLAITPLRRWLSALAKALAWSRGKRLSDWNPLARVRRLLGVSAFAYAAAHLALYLEFDLGYDWAAGLAELSTKPHLAAGAMALVIMAPLALTSTNGAMRALGRWWKRLHWLVYPVAVLALTHFWLAMKPGRYTPWPETMLLGILLGYRVLLATGVLRDWAGSDGGEVPERDPARPATAHAIAPANHAELPRSTRPSWSTDPAR